MWPNDTAPPLRVEIVSEDGARIAVSHLVRVADGLDLRLSVTSGSRNESVGMGDRECQPGLSAKLNRITTREGN